MPAIVPETSTSATTDTDSEDSCYFGSVEIPCSIDGFIAQITFGSGIGLAFVSKFETPVETDQFSVELDQCKYRTAENFRLDFESMELPDDTVSVGGLSLPYAYLSGILANTYYALSIGSYPYYTGDYPRYRIQSSQSGFEDLTLVGPETPGPVSNIQIETGGVGPFSVPNSQTTNLTLSKSGIKFTWDPATDGGDGFIAIEIAGVYDANSETEAVKCITEDDGEFEITEDDLSSMSTFSSTSDGKITFSKEIYESFTIEDEDWIFDIQQGGWVYDRDRSGITLELTD